MGNFVNIKDKINLKDKSEFVFAKPSGCFIQFRTYTIPDRLIVSSPSQGVLIDTGMISTGNDFVTFNIAIPTDATITLDAPNQYTAWDLIISGDCGFGLNTSGGQNINGTPYRWIVAALISQFRRSLIDVTATWTAQESITWLESKEYYPDLASAGTNTYYEEIIDQWDQSTNSYSIRVSRTGSSSLYVTYYNIIWTWQPPSGAVGYLAGTVNCNSTMVDGNWTGSTTAFGTTEEIYSPCYGQVPTEQGEPAWLDLTPVITYY